MSSIKYTNRFIVVIICITILSSIVFAIISSKNHNVLESGINKAFIDASETACSEIELFIETGDNTAYERLIATVGAMKSLSLIRLLENDKNDFELTAYSICVDNLIENKDASSHYLHLLNEAFRCYLDGKIETYRLRLSSFNNSVRSER